MAREMKYHVKALHRASQQVRRFVIQCSSEDEARARAESEGFEILAVGLMQSPRDDAENTAAAAEPDVRSPLNFGLIGLAVWALGGGGFVAILGMWVLVRVGTMSCAESSAFVEAYS